MIRRVNSIQFGRAKQSFAQRWAFFITFTCWCLMAWLLHASAGMIGSGLVVAAISHWSGMDLDHAARIEPGAVILRTGRAEERVPASQVTAIRVEETPGWLTRSVYVRIDRGRFDSFDVLRAKAPNTAEGRQRLQAKADGAYALLHSHSVQEGAQTAG